MTIQKLPKDSTVEILGHIFYGIEDIDKAVEVSARVSCSIGDRYIQREPAEKPVEGLHVLKLYEPYPCFDSSDYLYENRRYCNYFFSDKPFTDDDINRLASLPAQMNYCMVTPDLNSSVLPAVYFGGSSYNPILVAV